MRRDGLFKRKGRDTYFFRYKRSGVWKERSTGHSIRADAIDFKEKFETDLAEDHLPLDKSRWTVAQACGLWVDQHILGSQKARSNERSSLRQLLRILGSKRLDLITLDDLKNYQAQRSKTVKARPINIELSILVKTLKEQNLWKRSLSEHYKRLREPKPEIGRALTLEEVGRLEAAAGMRDSFLVAYCAEVLAGCTGLRGCEIKRLRLGNIDIPNRRIRVTRQSTKSDAGARLVELNRDALLAVAKLYDRAQNLGACSPDHYLLPADLSRHTRKDDPLRGEGFDPVHHQVSWNTAWRSLRKLAGLGTVRFHDMRHTFITMMGERGVPLQIVGAMVGHMSPEMVRYYTHISGNAARQAVEMLEKERTAPRFADTFADAPDSSDPKLLN